ncbi:pyridoxamine 5'-phosphate oxidase family protein [Mycobacterium sp. NPDC006124]|uniref:pyridoxamine 5'-phosphate oxidase family protein n=1 Tax=Mycobacterium sp. NPDC006124 TaxID=3156729 RepID=UPI0033B75522
MSTNIIPSSAGETSLTEADFAFLRRPLYGFFATASGPRPPQPRPVWFEVTDQGLVQLFTGPDTVKVRRLREDPRASLVVSAPVGERERWVSVSGRVDVVATGAHELAGRLAARYWDLDDPGRARDLADILAQDQVRLLLRPDKVTRYAME